MEKESSSTMTISLPAKLKQKLDKYPKKINKSKICRKALQNAINETEERMNPLLFFATTMGIVFSIVLLGISIFPSPLNKYIRGILALFAGLMAFTTGLTIWKYRRTDK